MNRNHARRAIAVRDGAAADLHMAAFTALGDADQLVPLLALALDVRDHQIVVLGGDDVEDRQVDGLLGRVAERHLEGAVDLDDPSVDVHEHRVEERIGEQAEARIVAPRL